MITDFRPRNLSGSLEYDSSDRIARLNLPADARLQQLARGIESAMAERSRTAVEHACRDFLAETSSFFNVTAPAVRVLGARPVRIYEAGIGELFGDYQINKAVIRVWMRTAVQLKVTSFGTLLNTLCHEFCHHLDIRLFNFPHSYHTRGFYARIAALYHHCRGTPVVPLVWRRMPQNRWRIDWGRMRRLRRNG